MRSTSLAAALCACALAVPCPASAQQEATLAFPLHTGPAASPAPGPGLELRPRADAFEALARPELERVRLSHVPTLAGAPLELELERVRIDTGRLQLVVDGDVVSAGVDKEGFSLWHGRVVGVENSEAFFGFSPHGSRGWYRTAGELVHLLPSPDPVEGWRKPHATLVSEARLAAAPTLRERSCHGPLLDAVGNQMPRIERSGTSTSPGTSAAAANPLTYECLVAWETDYQLYEQFADFDALEDYVLMLLGAVSQRYEEQIGTVLTPVYLAFYTTPADPWATPDIPGSTTDMLFEFQDAWKFNIPNGANLGHFLSGAPLGGGVAWLDVLCNEEWGFAVSANLTQFGLLPGSPAMQGPFTWDFYVIAHELGHNFATPHTFNYDPPLDDCPNVCITDGTIMSYCHLCTGGTENITTYFHPEVVTVMRTAVEASCLLELNEGLGSIYCSPAVDNSTGLPGRITVLGSNLVSDDDLVLTASDLPTESNTGYFIMGQGTNMFVPPGSAGPICVTPGLIRYLPPVSNTNELPGGFTRTVGTSGAQSGLITAGSTWNFQAWHRDQVAGTSNFTNAVSVSFQ